MTEDEDYERAVELLEQREARSRLRSVERESGSSAAGEDDWAEAGEKLG